MALCILLEPGRNLGVLLEDVGGFERIALHVKQAERDCFLAVLAGIPVIAGLNQDAVAVRQVEFPLAVAAEHVSYEAGGGTAAAPIARDIMEEVLRLDPSRKPRVDEQIVADAAPLPGAKP